jgi:hypothetical protein
MVKAALKKQAAINASTISSIVTGSMIAVAAIKASTMIKMGCSKESVLKVIDEEFVLPVERLKEINATKDEFESGGVVGININASEMIDKGNLTDRLKAAFENLKKQV